MSAPKIYQQLTTDELLQQVDQARANSPVVEALCVALEREQDAAALVHTFVFGAPCPVCLAKLTGQTDGLKMTLTPAVRNIQPTEKN